MRPTPGAIARLSPLGLDEVALEQGGALGDWQRRSRSATIPHCVERVLSSGALGNLERVAGTKVGAPHEGPVFSDSDVYKTLEAIAWEAARDLDPAVEGFGERATAILERAQRSDGYLDSWYQAGHDDLIWRDLRWGHELYCAGHLVQAAVAARRTGALPGLDRVAGRLVEHLLATFSSAEGDGRLVGVGGHPEVETALVEHFRETGDERALRLAARQVELRGRSDVALPTTHAIDGRPFGLSYFLHHQPVRSRKSATGHAVRELYLQAGVVDVATETGDEELLGASEAIWEDLYETKTYLTGAHGSRHRDESIGDPYELPSDRAYAETCAAIASFQWNWRLLLATGRPRYAQAMEQVLWNTIAGAVSHEGTEFFYSNTLHLRTAHEGDEDAPRHRLDWYECACCPPNLARLVASLQAYAATSDDSGLQLHLPFAGRISTTHAGRRLALELRTAHPWEGDSEIAVQEADPGGPITLSVRLPEWTDPDRVRLVLNGEPLDLAAKDGYLSLRRPWEQGDRLRLVAPMPIRLLSANHRVDATRGCAAIQRGPLVYCAEADDLEPGGSVEDVVLDVEPSLEATSEVPSGLDGSVKVAIRASGALAAASSGALYAATARNGRTGVAGNATTLTFVPYFARAQRPSAAMRVWVPVSQAGSTASEAGG